MKTGLAWFLVIASAVETNVFETVMISSRFFIPTVFRAKYSASDPEFTPIPYFVPI